MQISIIRIPTHTAKPSPKHTVTLCYLTNSTKLSGLTIWNKLILTNFIINLVLSPHNHNLYIYTINSCLLQKTSTNNDTMRKIWINVDTGAYYINLPSKMYDTIFDSNWRNCNVWTATSTHSIKRVQTLPN